MRKSFGTLVAVLLTTTPAAAMHGHNQKFEICYLQPHDVRVVREYYEPRVRKLPPGLAKKQAGGKELPPGWARRIQPLPVAVEQQLVVLPPGYRRGYVDGSVVVYASHSHVVVDSVAILTR